MPQRPGADRGAGASRSIPVAGAAPGGWVAPPGGSIPGREPGADDLAGPGPRSRQRGRPGTEPADAPDSAAHGRRGDRKQGKSLLSGRGRGKDRAGASGADAVGPGDPQDGSGETGPLPGLAVASAASFGAGAGGRIAPRRPAGSPDTAEWLGAPTVAERHGAGLAGSPGDIHAGGLLAADEPVTSPSGTGRSQARPAGGVSRGAGGAATAVADAPSRAPGRRAARPAEAAPERGAGKGKKLGRLAARQKASRRRVIQVYAISAGVAIVAGGALVLELLPSGGPAHEIVTPQSIGAYAQAPALAQSMKAAALRSSIVSESGGEASNVVAVVYQSGSSPVVPGTSGGASAGSDSAAGTGTAPIVLFIGGNLSGSSAGAFISSFMSDVPGATSTSAGPMGGDAACIPSLDGNPAECAWADNDTFGLVASPSLSTAALASEMRQMRLKIERRVR